MLWSAAAGAVALAIVAGLADGGRIRRRDLDRIGLLDWRTLQLAALVLALLLASVALNAQ